jgi:hypothetical protein
MNFQFHILLQVCAIVVLAIGSILILDPSNFGVGLSSEISSLIGVRLFILGGLFFLLTGRVRKK